NFTFYDSVKKEPPAVLEPAPAKPEPEPHVVPDPPKKAKTPAPEPPPVTSKRENVVNYQVGALRKAADAEKLLDAVKKKGFRAFILSPAPGDPNPLFKVQVGPFSDMTVAKETKQKLESAGYQPILKK